MERSIRRTRKEISDIIEMNDFNQWGTLTFDPKKHDSHNYAYVKKAFTTWTNNQKRLYGSFRHLAVPERHKDGKWHIHIFLGGFNGQITPTNQRRAGGTRRQAYKITSWEKTYGFADIEDIESKERLAVYVQKYVKKDINASSLEGKTGKRYWNSRALRRPEKLINPTNAEIDQYNVNHSESTDYSNEHVNITTIKRNMLE